MIAMPWPMRSCKAWRRSAQRESVFAVSIRELSSASAERSSNLVQLGESLRRADIVPFAAMHFARHQTARHRSAQQRRDLPLGSRFYAGKERRLVPADPAEGPFRVARVAYLRAAQGEVSARMVRGVRDQHQMRELLFRRARDQSGEIEIAKDVAVDGEKRCLAEQRKRLGDSSRGLQRLGLGGIANRHAEAT